MKKEDDFEGTCKKCAAYQPYYAVGKEHMGECRLAPPCESNSITRSSGKDKLFFVFPNVYETDWCMEFMDGELLAESEEVEK